MFPSRLIKDGSLTSDGDGFSFEIRVPWYRALPCSSLAEFDLKVDGRRVDPAQVLIAVNGEERPFADMCEEDDRWWRVFDPAAVRVLHPGGLAGEDHVLTLVLGLRIPYPKGHGEALVVKEQCSKRFRLRTPLPRGVAGARRSAVRARHD